MTLHRRVVRLLARWMVNTGDRLYSWTALPESKAYLAEVQRLRESAPHVYTFDPETRTHEGWVEGPWQYVCTRDQVDS